LTETERKHQEDLRHLDNLRPMDDEFMRCLFKDNIPLAQLVLRIITGKPDLLITDCQTQKDMKRLAGARSICLDAYGTDSSGKKYDLEVQREDKGAGPCRARYHASVLNIENLDAGQDFDELPECFTIFIMENDVYKAGQPVYIIERMNLTTGRPFADGEHIIYVNGAYRGESELGRLMHDFNCTNADEMYFSLMAERTRYLKETQKGVSEMSKIFEDIRREEREAGRLEGELVGLSKGRLEGELVGLNKRSMQIALRMLAAGTNSVEEIADITELSLDEVNELRKEQTI